MSKVTVIRKNKKFTMYRSVARSRGRGAKFQWNNGKNCSYTIYFTAPNIPTRTYNTFEEADKDWVFLELAS